MGECAGGAGVAEQDVDEVGDYEGPEEGDGAEEEEEGEQRDEGEVVEEDGEGLESAFERYVERCPADSW